MEKRRSLRIVRTFKVSKKKSVLSVRNIINKCNFILKIADKMLKIFCKFWSLSNWICFSMIICTKVSSLN